MKFLTRSLLTLFAFLFLFGCASKMNIPTFDTKTFDKNMYTSKVDNFLIVFDASSSLNEKVKGFQGATKFATAKALVNGMNNTLPEFGQTAGLRSFGHAPEVSSNRTELFYGMEKYSTQNLSDNFAKITHAGGLSPLDSALDAAGNDFDGLAGERNAVIIISDGVSNPNAALQSAKKLKTLYGSSICFFTILVGDDIKGENLLKEIADIGGCGFFSKADDILNSEGMAEFVEKVFLDKNTSAPAPAAPAAPVVSVEKDSDQDGVYDKDDQCPGTPMGAKVNAAGCWVLENVLFDFNKDVIKSMAYPLLDNVLEVLKENPAMNIELNGHCDNVGTPEYNMDLSTRRANAVKNYLVGKGISRDRLTTQGFGYTKPVALNGTDAGRAMNRRVELSPK